MKLHTMNLAETRTERNRVGRGPGSGNGKTSGRGQKGQKSRSGGGVRLGFEGGQTPLARRLPKRGFTNFNRKEYAIVNVETLNRFEDGATVNAAALIEAGIINKELSGLKVLGNGELTKKLTVEAVKFSKSAKEAIEKAGYEPGKDVCLALDLASTEMYDEAKKIGKDGYYFWKIDKFLSKEEMVNYIVDLVNKYHKCKVLN